MNKFENLTNLGHQYLGQVMYSDVESEQTHIFDDEYTKSGPQNVIPAIMADKSSFLVRFLKYWGQDVIIYDPFVTVYLIFLELLWR